MGLNLNGVSKGTWVRIVVLFLALVNQVSISLFDFTLLPFNDEQLYEGVSIVITTLATIWTSWKNNSFTKEAQLTDEALEDLKKK